MARPLIFLDVGGPLITFAPRPDRRDPVLSGSFAGGGNPLLDRLEPADGRRLLELGCDLIWATTWAAEANEVISPGIGLPDCPWSS
jgi:hypothetical protein